MVQLVSKNKSFVDISLAFTPNPINGDITVLKDERAINNSIRNCVMISVNEVPFNHLMGSTVNDYLFEVMDELTEDELEDEILRTIKRNEPRADVTGVIANILPDSNSIDVQIYYKIKGYDEVITVDFILSPTSA